MKCIQALLPVSNSVAIDVAAERRRCVVQGGAESLTGLPQRGQSARHRDASDGWPSIPKRRAVSGMGG